jgi:hypothetical protein
MRLAIAAILLVACTDEPSSGGPDVTTRVESFQIPSATTQRCFDSLPADVDPDTAGAQYDCSISETVSGVEKVFPLCNSMNDPVISTNKPCWAIIVDQQNCTRSGRVLRIERGTAPPDGLVNGQCLVQ